MVSPSSKARRRTTFLCIPIPFRKRKAANDDIRLDQSVKVGPTPTPAGKAPDHELTEEKTKSVRLEEENRRIKARADELAEANRKLEDELRQAKELLANKDASLQRLEKAISGMQTKVGRIESRIDFQ